MTFGEFFAVLTGYADRIHDDRYLHASMTALLLSPHMKKGRRITTEKILGIKERRVLRAKDFATVEQWRAALAEAHYAG